MDCDEDTIFGYFDYPGNGEPGYGEQPCAKRVRANQKEDDMENKKPTIKELEKILDGPKQRTVINPDGSLSTRNWDWMELLVGEEKANAIRKEISKQLGKPEWSTNCHHIYVYPKSQIDKALGLEEGK
jgi:hypothetical protein